MPGIYFYCTSCYNISLSCIVLFVLYLACKAMKLRRYTDTYIAFNTFLKAIPEYEFCYHIVNMYTTYHCYDIVNLYTALAL